MAKTKTDKKATGSRALQVVTPDIRKLMIAHAKATGIAIHVDKDYRAPAVLRKFILWMEFKDKFGIVHRKPHVEHGGLVDALSREGYQGVEDTPLESVPCRKAGCYGATEHDYQQRALCRVTLRDHKGRPGKYWQAMGDACKHNTSSMISGHARDGGRGKGGNSLLRMSETRAMGRAIGRVLDIPILSIMELPAIDRTVVWKKNDKVLTPQGVEKIVEDQIIEADFSPVTDSAEKVGGERDPARTPVNRELHGLISKLGFPVDAAHDHLCDLAGMARHRATPKAQRPLDPTPVKSVGGLSPVELADCIKYLKRFTPSQVDSLKRTFARKS